MNFRTRMAIIAGWPLVAVVVALYGWSRLSSLPPAVGEPVLLVIQWLVIITIMYIVNHYVAWRNPTSWTLFLTRSLVWAVLAYLCISNIVDLIGLHSGTINQILGIEAGGEPAVLSGLRLRLGGQFIMLAMAVTCIGFGFESTSGTEQ